MTELEIKIRTVLEGQGIKATDDQLKSLARSSKEAQSATAGTGKAAREAGDAISQFGRKGSEAKDAFEGLTTVARGGEGAIFGMAKAWRALTAAFASNPITATLAVILGILPLIQKGFDFLVSSAEKARDAMAGTGEQSRKAADGMKEIGAASETYIKAATAQADALASAYNGATSAIDAALSRFKQVEQARAEAQKSAIEFERQRALASAKSPDEETAINAQFDEKAAAVSSGSAQAIAGAERDAVLKKKEAATAQASAASQAIAAAKQKVEVAKKAEANAWFDAQDTRDVASYANALRAREQAERDADIVIKKNQPLLENANRDLTDVDAAIKAADYRTQTLKNTDAAGNIKRAAALATTASGGVAPGDSSRRAELIRKAETAQAAGDWVGQSSAVAELRRMAEAAKKLKSAVTENAASVSGSMEATAKKVEKQTMRTKNTAESRAGS